MFEVRRRRLFFVFSFLVLPFDIYYIPCVYFVVVFKALLIHSLLLPITKKEKKRKKKKKKKKKKTQRCIVYPCSLLQFNVSKRIPSDVFWLSLSWKVSQSLIMRAGSFCQNVIQEKFSDSSMVEPSMSFYVSILHR